MALSNEVKVGALGIAAVVLFVFGYNYLKGKNLFTVANSYYVEYDKVDGMTTGAMVTVNGFQVGSVSDLYLKPGTIGKIEAVLMLDRGIEIPPDTEANIFSPDPLSGKAIRLIFDKNCNGSSIPCAESGAKLKGSNTGLIGSMTGDLTPHFEKAKEIYQNIVDTVKTKLKGSGDGKMKKDLDASIKDLQSTLKNLNSATGKLDKLLDNSTGQLETLLNNMNSITGNLKKSNQSITNILLNAESFTSDLKKLNLDKTLQGANGAIANLDGTMKNANEAIDDVQTLLKKVSEGEGTIAKVMNDDKMYTNLNNAIRDMDFLLKDFRLNPRRYINVSVIGRKPKPYKGVENDPEGRQE